MGISFHRGLVLGNLEEGSSSGDFERRMKGALGWGYSLSDEAPWRGPLGGGLLHWEPGKICSDSLRMWAPLSIGALLFLRGTWCLGEARIPGGL